MFSSPQIVLFTRDIHKAIAFYTAIGFTEAFRARATGARSVSTSSWTATASASPPRKPPGTTTTSTRWPGVSAPP